MNALSYNFYLLHNNCKFYSVKKVQLNKMQIYICLNSKMTNYISI